MNDFYFDVNGNEIVFGDLVWFQDIANFHAVGKFESKCKCEAYYDEKPGWFHISFTDATTKHRTLKQIKRIPDTHLMLIKFES